MMGLKRHRWLLALTVLICGSVGQAEMSSLDKIIYVNVKSQCASEEQGLVHGLQFVDSMHSSFGSINKTVMHPIQTVTEFKSSLIMQTWRDRGLSPTVAMTLNSEGFYKALRECYPDSQDAQDSFTLWTIVADTMGRGVGTIQAVVLYHLLARFKAVGLTAAVIYAAPTIREMYDEVRSAQKNNADFTHKYEEIAGQTFAAIILLEQKRRSGLDQASQCELANEQYEYAQIALNLRTDFINRARADLLKKYAQLFKISENLRPCQ